jgi:hypothetical protein
MMIQQMQQQQTQHRETRQPNYEMEKTGRPVEAKLPHFHDYDNNKGMMVFGVSVLLIERGPCCIIIPFAWVYPISSPRKYRQLREKKMKRNGSTLRIIITSYLRTHS